MLRVIALCICLSTAFAAAEGMTAFQAARMANTAYLNHRDALIEQLTTQRGEQRREAMRLLGRLDDPAATDHLLPFLDELANTPEDMIAAMRALADMNATVAAPVFAAHRNHPNQAVSKAAYNALARMQALSGTHHLDLSDSDTPALRATGIIGVALSDADRQLAGQALVKALADDDDAHIRRMAAIGLGDLGNRDLAPALVTALSDPNPGVRRHAAASLVRLDYRQAIPSLLIAMEANFAGAYLNRALIQLSGQDFGFDHTAPAAARRIAIDKAFRWYTANAE